MVPITNALQSTTIFILILFGILLLTVRKKKKEDGLFSPEDTQELKGFAIIAIIIAHIGYILASDNRFLQPYSYFAGMGVDIFLILSGFGLAASMLKNKQTVAEFYVKRFKKLYVPMWIALIFGFTLCYFLLDRSYSLQYILQSAAGLFTSASAFQDVNSPLWYFTFILLYYLLFPFIFSRRFPWLTSILFFVLGYVFISQKIAFFGNVVGLYRLHIAAFPVGILLAWFAVGKDTLQNILSTWSKSLQKTVAMSIIMRVIYIGILVFLLNTIFYYVVNSGVGQGWKIVSFYSMLTALLTILFVIIKNFKIRLFSLFGNYSYEIYLTHWPIAYVSTYLWSALPTWLAMLAYLVIVLSIGVIMQVATNRKKKDVHLK